MNVEIPVYIRSLPRVGKQPPMTEVRGLFLNEYVETAPTLERALDRLAIALRKRLREMGRSANHAELVRSVFSPDLMSQTLDVAIEVNKISVRGPLLIATVRTLERRLAFTPQIPHYWFEVTDDQTLASRVHEALSDYFAKRSLEVGEEKTEAEVKALVQGTAGWLTTIDLEFGFTQELPTKGMDWFTLVRESDNLDGDQELEKVGRSLVALYPHELEPALLREPLVDELTNLLDSPDGRPVVLIGPRAVGKTAVIHRWLYRQITHWRDDQLPYRGVWHLSPQRLISGMTCVGQWEDRVLAILKAAMKRQHLLVFDDLLGLFQAGRSAQSDLTVIDVLKPYMERREVRVLAEATPETWRVLLERDRSLGELFRVLHVPEPTEDDSLRIAISVVNRLEGQHRVRFDYQALPTALDLSRRYIHDAVMPGKLAGFLSQIAGKYVDETVDRKAILHEFQLRSGLSMSFLDDCLNLSREDVIEGLSGNVIGQPGALATIADFLALSKARLNDPGRPIASLLFLGPTGVGKTQTAKALAAWLFGDAERMLRFDMNEFVAEDAVTRLVGTFHEPDGLLTGAIRRQPFSVILLDEIEKAHPRVFDILLQVLGEGRLTDAVGRTTDFTNTIIVLTSNLGVRRSQVGMGFDPPGINDAHRYTKAAENFFRPEFFNRLDRVVPFLQLRKDEVRRIADLMLTELLQREGLRRRRCALLIEPRAIEQVVELAYDSVLGARAMRRGFERQVIHTVADELSQGLPDAPTVVRVYPGPDGVRLRLIPLLHLDSLPPIPAGELADELLAIRQIIEETDAQCEAIRPTSGFVAGEIDSTKLRYLGLRERVNSVRQLLRQCEDLKTRSAKSLEQGHKADKSSGSVSRKPKWERTYWTIRRVPSFRGFIRDAISARDDMRAFFQELIESEIASKTSISEFERILDNLRTESLFLRKIVHPSVDESLSCYLLIESSLNEDRERVYGLGQAWKQVFTEWRVIDATMVPEDELVGARCALRLDGPGATFLADLEVGTHLFTRRGLGFSALRARRILLSSDETLADRLRAEEAARAAWLDAVQAGTANLEDDPDAWSHVVRVCDENGFIFDPRTNTLSADELWLVMWRSMQAAIAQWRNDFSPRTNLP